MAENNSFDCGTTDLLCDEETKGLCFDDGELVEPFNDQSHQSNGGKGNGRSDSEPSIFLPCPSEECIGWMVERERLQLPRDDYLMRLRSGKLDMNLRREALDWMFKACSHHNFGELCLYLAMNYLDRFLSVYNIPAGKTWAVQLVAVSCLSLAAKVNEVNVPSLVDLQAGEPKFLFEGKTVQRMEILVLNYLNWNMKAYTPFDFIDYFLRKMNGTQFPLGSLITRSIQIILSTIKGIDFLEFRPSEIAAAVAVYASGSGEIQAVGIERALSSFIGVIEKERMVKCLELISKTAPTSTIGIAMAASVSNGPMPHSPNGVLDAACMSYKSGEGTVGSCPSSSNTSPDTKRRK